MNAIVAALFLAVATATVAVSYAEACEYGCYCRPGTRC